jgi:hypothetical protein
VTIEVNRMAHVFMPVSHFKVAQPRSIGSLLSVFGKAPVVQQRGPIELSQSERLRQAQAYRRGRAPNGTTSGSF